MKTAVVYYSKNGSNKFIAGKTAESLEADLIPLKPRLPGLVVAATVTKISFGNKPLSIDFSGYDQVILCGSLYMGKFSAPCNDFIKKYGGMIKRLHILTCCASTDEGKYDTFGYGLLFDSLKAELGGKAGIMEALPINLVLPPDTPKEDPAMMNTRLSADNFSGAIAERHSEFLKQLKSQ